VALFILTSQTISVVCPAVSSGWHTRRVRGWQGALLPHSRTHGRRLPGTLVLGRSVHRDARSGRAVLPPHGPDAGYAPTEGGTPASSTRHRLAPQGRAASFSRSPRRRSQTMLTQGNPVMPRTSAGRPVRPRYSRRYPVLAGGRWRLSPFLGGGGNAAWRQIGKVALARRGSARPLAPATLCAPRCTAATRPGSGSSECWGSPRCRPPVACTSR
jgi:hypothetical protein